MRKVVLILAMIGIILVHSNIVVAVGVAPAKRSIEFVPQLEKSFNGLIINNEDREIYVEIEENDPFGILSIEFNNLTLSATEKDKQFKYTVKLPEKMNEEKITAKIIVKESTPKGDISAVVIVESLVEVINNQIIKDNSDKMEDKNIVSPETSIGQKEGQENNLVVEKIDNKDKIEIRDENYKEKYSGISLVFAGVSLALVVFVFIFALVKVNKYN